MKIVQVMPEFGLAGAEIMAENLIYGLINQGHSVLAVSLYDRHTAITDRLENKGVQIVYVGKQKGFDRRVFGKLRSVFKDFKPDIIHTHRYVLPYVYAAARGLNVRIVHTIHNVAEKEVGPRQQSIQNIIFKSRKVVPVAISPLIKKSVLERYKLDDASVPMVFNGIDLSNCIQKDDYSLSAGGLILHIGRFSAQKNHMRLIEAFDMVHKEFPSVKMQLIGAGELEDKIKELVFKNNLGDNVVFSGLQSNVYPALHNADIFVLSSNYEGMPITLIEAMGTGLPIVSTSVGGIPDMLSGKDDAILVDLTSESLAKGMIDYLQDKSKREMSGKLCIEESKRFSLDEMTNCYLEVYKFGSQR